MCILGLSTQVLGFNQIRKTTVAARGVVPPVACLPSMPEVLHLTLSPGWTEGGDACLRKQEEQASRVIHETECVGGPLGLHVTLPKREGRKEGINQSQHAPALWRQRQMDFSEFQASRGSTVEFCLKQTNNPNQERWHTLLTPMLERQRQVDSWGLPASWSNLLGKFQVSDRSSL